MKSRRGQEEILCVPQSAKTPLQYRQFMAVAMTPIPYEATG